MDLHNLNKAPGPPINEMPHLDTTQDEKVWTAIALAGIAILAGVGIWILIEATQTQTRQRSKGGMPYSAAEEQKMASDREYI
jgi:hypothetical protein